VGGSAEEREIGAAFSLSFAPLLAHAATAKTEKVTPAFSTAVITVIYINWLDEF